MGRSPCCDNSSGLKKGPWTPEEDEKLTAYIQEHGYGSWRALPKLAGLNRCGKSCRLRWTNYLRPDIKRGKFADDEEALIIKLHSVLGNKWSRIATHLPGRTDNEIKNFWNTHIRKKLLQMGIDPITHKPRTDLNLLANLSHLLSTQNLTSTSGSMTMNQPPTTTTNLANWDNMNALRLQSDATQLAKLQILSNIFQILNTNTGNSSPHLIPPPLLDQNTSHHHQLGGGGDGEGGFQNLLVSASSNGLTTPTTTMDPISFLGEFSNSSAAAAAASSHAYPWGTGGSPTTNSTIDRAYRSFMSSSLADNSDQRAEPTENSVLPALVTFSPKQPSYSDAVQVEAISKSNTNSAYGSSACTDQSPSDDFFEGLDKLIDDDGTSGSFWKDFITN